MKWFIKIYLLFTCQILWANILHVPAEYATIQDGINAAAEGDTILVAPGIYYEQLLISEKSITLVSNFMLSQDLEDISQTIIDGNRDAHVISIDSSAGNETIISGFTIRNARDGIYPFAPFNISDCIITNCTDGIDYESGSGGICVNNTFRNNRDDGVDLDGAVDIIIENNRIIDNRDDGIEIRLHPYEGVMLDIIIKNNIINGNGEDGIQLIDYGTLSDRFFRIENNLVANNDMAGLGMMADSNTIEDYQGAAISESIFLVNNTFDGNNHGISGGANLEAFNNIISNCAATAAKNVVNSSLISFSVLWNNNLHFDNCSTDSSTLIFSDPLFAANDDYHIQDTSPCIEHGNPPGSPLADIEYMERGNPPDIGAYENTTIDSIPILQLETEPLTADNFILYQNYPNPFNAVTTIKFHLETASNVKLSICDLAGHELEYLLDKHLTIGSHQITWNATGYASGVYLCRLQTRYSSRTKKLILLK